MRVSLRFVVGCAAALALCAVARVGNAAFIQADDAVFGVNAVVRETSLGREYLRLDFTNGRSYDDVLGELGSGGDFEGWTIASGADLLALRDAAGLASNSRDLLQLAMVDQLVNWFCFACVNTSSSQITVRGLTSDTQVLPIQTFPFSIIRQVATSFGRQTFPQDGVLFVSSIQFDPAGQIGTGVFLTRAVPEPSIWLLLGLAGLFRRAQVRRLGAGESEANFVPGA